MPARRAHGSRSAPWTAARNILAGFLIAGLACSTCVFAKPIEFEIRILEVRTATASLGEIHGKWVSFRAISDTDLMTRIGDDITFPISSVEVDIEDTPAGTLHGTLDWPQMVMQFDVGGRLGIVSKSPTNMQGIAGQGLPWFAAYRFDRRLDMNLVVQTVASVPPNSSQVSWTPDMPGVAPHLDASSSHVGTLSIRTAEPAGLAAVEFHHAGFDHYFMTAAAEEIAKLDNDPSTGWLRTGEQLKVYPIDYLGTANVCRFFSVAFSPKSSHFYTANANECAQVMQNPHWRLEGQVFALDVPTSTGSCVLGTVPIYRLYNNGQGGAPNHRYTTSMTTRDAMIGRGWVAEGAGALGVGGCALN